MHGDKLWLAHTTPQGYSNDTKHCQCNNASGLGFLAFTSLRAWSRLTRLHCYDATASCSRSALFDASVLLAHYYTLISCEVEEPLENRTQTHGNWLSDRQDQASQSRSPQQSEKTRSTFSVTRANMDFTVDSNDTTNAATTQETIAACSDATAMLRQATAIQSAPVTTPSILLLPAEVRVMVWKHFFSDLTVYVRSDHCRLVDERRVFLLASPDGSMASYSPHPLYYTSRLVRLEITDMLWRLAMFRASDDSPARPLPIPISSRIRNLELDWDQYVDIFSDIRYPFLNELDEPETPQQIQITGCDSLQLLKLVYHDYLRDGGSEQVTLDSIAFTRLIYFKKPFLLEFEFRVDDDITNTLMIATYSSQSGMEFEYATRMEANKNWEKNIQIALGLWTDDIEDCLQADMEDRFLVSKGGYDRVKKYISHERLGLFKMAWEKYFDEES